MMRDFDKIRHGLAQIKVNPAIRPIVDNINLQLDNATRSEDLEDVEDLQLSDSLSLISAAHEQNKII